MSRADYVYLKTTNKILEGQEWDTKEKVRTKWSDGTPAHAVKIFNSNNVYKLADEFPLTSLRKISWKGAIDEMMWIWVKKSNNINDLNSHVWDQWADKTGSIGEAYGAQVRKKSVYPDGEYDQIDRIIYFLKNQPAFRSMVAELFVHQDLHKMGLYPCVHGLNFDVSNGKLNLFINQRSNDTLVAGNWNVVQYSALVYMLAQVCGLEPGTVAHEVVNAHIYDKHIPFIVDMTFSRAMQIQKKLQEIKFVEIERMMLDPVVKEKFEEFKEEILRYDVNFETAIEEAQNIEVNELKNTQAYEDYSKKTVDTKKFRVAKMIVNGMYNNPEFDELLGYSKPKLILDPNVKDFYDFVTPLKKDENGKFVSNEKGSFKVENYNPEKEGVKLKVKVPVAE